jgi:hypothetical protein
MIPSAAAYDVWTTAPLAAPLQAGSAGALLVHVLMQFGSGGALPSPENDETLGGVKNEKAGSRRDSCDHELSELAAHSNPSATYPERWRKRLW